MCKYFYAYTKTERKIGRERGETESDRERERERHHMCTNHIWDSESLAIPHALKHHAEYCTLI